MNKMSKMSNLYKLNKTDKTDNTYNMCNMTTFVNNISKQFKFTTEQYMHLEIEYTRYVIYTELIKQIECILQITEEYDMRKKYESKNIIERFVLECINNGIINYDNLSHYLFFNPVLDNINLLCETPYYIKMISEYNEKKIRLTPIKILNIDKAFIDANKRFKLYIIQQEKQTETIKNDNKLFHSTNIYKNIHCSILLNNNDCFVIRYRDYTKILCVNRYYKLIKNYDKPYPYDIIRMLLRYSIFDMSSQQWSIGDLLYEDISDIFDISFEMFASPLNFNMNMFCSIFLDTDRIFGSIGSFYGLEVEKLLLQNIKGVFFNPPYLPLLMNTSIIHCLNILNEMNSLTIDFTIVSFLPNWSDAEYIKTFVNSKYVVSSKIVNKGNYVLHEKDKGKLISGSFDLVVIVLNSMKSSWNNDKKSIILSGIDKIVEIMKTESRTLWLSVKK